MTTTTTETAPRDISIDELQLAYVTAKKERQKAEHERLRVQNDLHWECFEGTSMITVPLSKDKPIRILDSATGDGYWMQQESKNYPNATFVGTDVDPDYFGALENLSPKINFKVQNLLEPWPEEDKGAYDFVHQRYVMTNMPKALAPDVIKNLFSLVKPGGYIQLVEADIIGFDRDGHPGEAEKMDFMAKFFATGDMDPTTGPRLGGWLQEAGAEEVETKEMSFGIGARGKTKEQQEKSAWNELTLVDNLAFVCNRIPNFWYTSEQFEKLAQMVKEEMDTVGNTWRFHVVTARRPL